MSNPVVEWPTMYPVKGVELGTANARIKDTDRDDVLIFALSEGSHVSGVFTQNVFCAEPVKIAKQHMAQVSARYLLINSGNANACTGELGFKAAMQTCDAVASQAKTTPQHVLPFSTGVIGETLPADKIVSAVPEALTNLAEQHWLEAGQAIMTTDTCPKGASEQITIGGTTVTITGIAKGAGMINPNMATMLGFIATDVAIEPALLDRVSRQAANASFNRITIDGDTSTNDACMLMATGKAGNPLIQEENSDYTAFLDAVVRVHQKLAKAIVKDGEGATKFITVDVQGGQTKQECDDIAYAIAHSPLVKTAMFASDPNWGRIICAIGYAGVPLNPELVTVHLDDVLIVEKGGRAASYTEEQGQSIVDKSVFTIRVNLNRGNEQGVLWTSDLSHEYVRINAEYRT